MFDFFLLMIAVVALIVAAKTFNQIAALRTRLDTLERSAAETRAAVAPSPLALQQQAEPPTPSPEIVAEHSMPAAETSPAAPESAADATSTPLLPPLPQFADSQNFEERIGTRWVVWVGGLTLALGGFFMVRYSIEAGLIGPGVRVMLGGAFALALLAAGEFLRRKEDPAAIDALPIANSLPNASIGQACKSRSRYSPRAR
jgi:uncharacterized membrane protein